MFVIIYRHADPRQNLYYCSYRSVMSHPDETFRRFGELGGLPCVFGTREKALAHVDEWSFSDRFTEVIPCPPEMLSGHLNQKALELHCELLKAVAKLF